MLPAERGLVSTSVRVCVCVCMCVHACAWCACTSTHVRVHAVSACMDAHLCVRGMCETGGEGVSQEAAGHFPFVQRDPALPPGLPTRPHRSAGAPREALEPEGSRDQAPSLLSAALLTCISVPSPGRLHWEHVALRQWRDLIPISARPPEATVCARGGKALSAQAPDYSPGQALVVGLALRVTLP